MMDRMSPFHIALLVGLVAALACQCMAADTFPVVDGKTEAVIVGNDSMNSCTENGYKTIKNFLQTYVQKSTGRKLKNIRPADYDPEKVPYAIVIGYTKQSRERYAALLKNLDRDAYIIDVTPNAVYLIGARSHSTYYAMIDFLYRATGTATYIPSKWGTIVPKHKTVRVPLGFHVESPAFIARAFSCLRTYRDTGPRLNYGGNADIPWRIYRRGSFHHAIHTFITVKEFGKTHPEYFPERNGKRIIISTGSGPGPCISNPEVVKIVIKKAREYFDDPKNKDKHAISLGMTDGGWCECAKCQALDGPDIRGNEKARGRRYYWFLNQVANALRETHPDKYVGVLAYAGADWPPANFPVARNIIPYICQTRANWGDPDVIRTSLEQTYAWTKRVDRVGIYEYLYGAGFMVPRVYHKHLARYLQAVKDQGQGEFYAEIYSNHGLDGPKAWIAEKLLWNPYQDTEALQTTWCKAVFEESAGPMDKYFAYLEECNTKNILRCPDPDVRGKARTSKFHMLQVESQFYLFLPAEIAKAEGYLAQAMAATKQPAIRERIQYFTDCLKVTGLSVKAFHAFNEAQALHKKNASHREILAALIRGEALGPTEDPLLAMQEMVVKDPSTFTGVMPVAIATSTDLSMRIVHGTPWGAVRAMVKKGQRDREALVGAAQAEVRKLAPKGWEKDKFAKRRVGTLLSMTERIVVANKTDIAPVIDGDVSDKAWKWQTNGPWWQWKSGVAYKERADIAFCYKGNTLYVATRCYQPDVKQRRRSDPSYGAPAWKYVSMELHLNPHEKDADKKDVDRYQVIPALGGGLYSRAHDVVKAWKVTDTDTYWQVEMALDLAKIKMTPDRFPLLQMNLIRNTREQGHYGKGWFPSSSGHADYHARGWLIFE